MEWYCDTCFCDVIEKRIRKYIRTETPVEKNEHLLILGELCMSVLKAILHDLPITLSLFKTEKELAAAQRLHIHARVVLPWTMDREIGTFLGNFFQGKSVCEDKRIIKLFMSVTERELNKYTEIRKLSYPSIAHDPVFDVLDALEEKYPSSKYSLLKSANALRPFLERGNSNGNIKDITVDGHEHGHTIEY